MSGKTVVHSGLWIDCKNCNPEFKAKKDKREKRSRVKGKVTLEVYVRRQVSEELGEDEGKDAKFQLLQKYGIAAARIDRQATRPNWMGEAEWKRKQNDWYRATKGLVAPQQQSRVPRVILDKYGKPLARTFVPRQRDTRESHRNFGRGPTANRPS